MKKYIIPEMKLSRFESESVVTQARGTQQTAQSRRRQRLKMSAVHKRNSH